MSDDLHGLSDAERAALEDEDDLNPPADPVDDEDDDEDDDDAAGAGNPANAQDEDSEAALAQSVESFSIPSADLDELSQKISALQESRDQMEADYESGESELTYAEHRAQLRDIDAQVRQLSEERAESRAIQKMNAAYQEKWWEREVSAFKKDALKDGVDYDGDEKLGAAWNKAVQFLGSDPDNAGKDGRWFLQEAHEMVKARFRVGAARADSTAKPARSRVDEALSARRRKGELPPNLRDVPEAGREDEGASEFSHLDKLGSEELEKAVARMTPEQQDRWARA